MGEPIEIPKEIREPAPNVPVHLFWQDTYQHIFFSLNPLFRVPATIDAQPADIIAVDGKNFFNPSADVWDRHPDFDTIIKTRSETLGWRALHKQAFPEIPFQKFALALWLSSVLGHTGEVDIGLQVGIEKFCSENGWFLPDENETPPCQEHSLFKFFKSLGISTLTAHDEFRENSEQIDIEQLMSGQESIGINTSNGRHRVNCLYAETAGVVLIWSFDNVSAVVGMTDAAYKTAPPEDHLEVIRATPKMQLDWIRQLNT